MPTFSVSYGRVPEKVLHALHTIQSAHPTLVPSDAVNDMLYFVVPKTESANTTYDNMHLQHKSFYQHNMIAVALSKESLSPGEIGFVYALFQGGTDETDR